MLFDIVLTASHTHIHTIVMEMLTALSPALISLVVVVALLLFIRAAAAVVMTIKNAAAGSSTPSLPPGPSKLPLIGSIHHLMATGGELPHHAVTRLALEHGPVMHLQTGQVELVIISSCDASMEVQDANFAYRSETAPRGQDPPLWLR